MTNRGLALGAALVLDRCTPEPPNAWHPVAWFGSTMGAVERRTWADSRAAGALYTAIGVTLGSAAGRAVRSTTVALTIALGGASLRSIASSIGGLVDRGELEQARLALPSLVGRDTSELDESGLAAAVVESVAENCVDAVIAPMFWAFVAGAPGALGYRAVNTMDAMVGHRNERYESFGWASARLDDVANFVPARLFAAGVWVLARDRRGAIERALRTDAPAHPSPNAGYAEAAVAAAIGVELGGPLQYGERVEQRPLLGDGPRPTSNSIGAAIAMTDRVAAMSAVAGLLVGWRRRSGPR